MADDFFGTVTAVVGATVPGPMGYGSHTGAFRMPAEPSADVTVRLDAIRGTRVPKFGDRVRVGVVEAGQVYSETAPATKGQAFLDRYEAQIWALTKYGVTQEEADSPEGMAQALVALKEGHYRTCPGPQQVFTPGFHGWPGECPLYVEWLAWMENR